MRAKSLGWIFAVLAWAVIARAEEAPPPPSDESVLGEFVVTGTVKEHVTVLAVLPSLSLDLSDVIVRSVVRNDLELTGMFSIVPDAKAPPGTYDFDEPVDVDAWRKLGAEVIVKVAARPHLPDQSEVLGLAYFSNAGAQPVYQKQILADAATIRVTAHRLTDALLGAITGRPGGFASHFIFSSPWVRASRIFVMDSDGHGLAPITNETDTAIAPTWGPGSSVYYSVSHDYAPYALFRAQGEHSQDVTHVELPFRDSVYGVDFNPGRTRLAVAVSNESGSSVWVGNADATQLARASTTEVATHPAWSPSGKLAWIGGRARSGGVQRVYVDGVAVSPAGFTAASPVFCDTEDGIRLIYSVGVRGNREDLVMSDEHGRGIVRLTQGQGTNHYPACSSDGRLLAFFSVGRPSGPGIYVMSLQRWATHKITDRVGDSLRWASLPEQTRSPG
jgi:TolB protein